MDIIRNYLETMFANLPNTEEIRRAKDELYSMMEDKYNELIGEGKTENEAVGTVISEFGNLDDLAESLGIEQAMNNVVVSDRRILALDEVENFISDSVKQKFFIGLGVMLCCLALIGPIIFAPISEMMGNPSLEAIGVILMFMFVAAGVGLFIFASFQTDKWKYLDQELCAIDFSTAEYLAREKSENQIVHTCFLTVGVILCVVSVIPVILFSMLFGDSFKLLSEGFGPAMIFVCAGIGVFLIILSTAKDSAFDKLLTLNDVKTVAGNYEPVKETKKEKKVKKGKRAKDVSQAYWRVVLLIYIILSFSSFDWGKTWMIWPIAGIFHKPICKMFGAIV